MKEWENPKSHAKEYFELFIAIKNKQLNNVKCLLNIWYENKIFKKYGSSELFRIENS